VEEKKKIHLQAEKYINLIGVKVSFNSMTHEKNVKRDNNV
jgi:hypothetical protein